MDTLHEALKWVSYNRYIVIAATLAIVVSSWLVGCQSKTSSLTDPGAKIGRVTLDAEALQVAASLERERVAVQEMIAKADAEAASAVAAYNAKAQAARQRIEIAKADLDRQDQVKRELLASLGQITTQATTGGVTPAGAITAALGAVGLLLGAGAKVDSVRKDAVIRDLKTTKTTEATTTAATKT